ncbi:casB [Symbiodinium sp. KB8]|nr:casB [Symbiodinium sp. KB8]
MACSAACRLRRAIPASIRALQGPIEHPPAWWSKALGGVRGIIRHPVKATGHILGHKLEVVQGSKKRPRLYMPPKIPKHPLQDIEANMNELLTYNDLKLRWQFTTRFSTSRMGVARHWKPQRTDFPRSKPTCSFIWHDDMPHRSPQPELPKPKHFDRIKEQELFCVFKSSLQAQGISPGESSPTSTVAGIDMRQWVTMLRIDEIVLMPEEDPTDPPPPKPVRLLDLWANRWLDPAEKAGIEMVKGEDGALIPKTALIYEPWRSCYALDSQEDLTRPAEITSRVPFAVRFYKSVAWLVFKFSKNMPSQPSLRLTWSLHAAKQISQSPSRCRCGDPFGMMEEEAADIRAKEREMASIKARISSLSDAKRQASSAEEQLSEVLQEVTRLRERLAHVQHDLKSAVSRKKDAEKDITDLEIGMVAFKETLHLRQLSVAELRSNKDETERQLAQTLRERELFRESATKAQQGFDTEAKSASAELDRWRSEAHELASAIEALDVQKKELQEKASSEDSEKAFVASLQKELDEAMAAYAAFEEQNRSDDVNLAAAEARQRDAETRLREAEQAANDLRSELQEEGEGARTATEAVKRELAVQVSKVAQLEGSLGENRNQLKTIQRHVDSLTHDLLDRTVKSAEDEEAVTSLSKQLQQEQQALERLQSEKEKLESAAAEELERAEECRRSKQALEEQQIHVELVQRSDVLSTTKTEATTELTSAVAEIAQLQQAHALPLLWQGILLPLAIAHSGSAKPAHVHIAYDGSASRERQESQLLRSRGLKPEGPEEGDKSEAQQAGWYIEDEVENTIAKAQSFDFDKKHEQMLRHIHYTAATSPTGRGPGVARDTWHISSHGPPVTDEAEGRIVEDQQRAEKAGLPPDFKSVPPVAAVMKKPPVSATLPPNLPKDCFKARHSTDIGEDETCPEACPLFAEDTMAGKHCVFKCVLETDCGVHTSATNLAQSVPDADVGFCRRCSVPGCSRCNRTAHSDVCGECLRGFALEEGACVFQLPIVGTLVQSMVYIALFIPVVYFIIWYVSLATRKKVNLDEEAQALQFRTQTKLCTVDTVTEDAPEERQLWPLKTNTLQVPVAGPGSVLFFRYQVFIMILSLVLLILWVTFLGLTGSQLSALGTEDPKSPRELCNVIHHGFEAQQTYMWAKSCFVLAAYVISVVLCMLFAIHQRRTFNRLNVFATHADFVALLDGLPAISGSEELEDLLKKEMEKASSEEIVGVSIGWHVGDDTERHNEQISKILEEDVLALENLKAEQDKAGEKEADEVQVFSRQRPKWLRIFDRVILTGMLGIDTIPPPPEELAATQASPAQGDGTSEAQGAEKEKDAAASSSAQEVEKEKAATAGKASETEKADAKVSSEPPEALCTKLQSSPTAVVVFRTETARDAALEKCKSIPFREATLTLKPLVTEPLGILWENMSIPNKLRRERLFASIKMIVLAGAAWAVCIYLPYAFYAASFSYSNGDKPSALMNMSLALIVVLGNLIMYTTCAEAAKRIGHMLRDTEAGVYMVLYTFAILFNILLDAAVGGYIAYRTAVANHARTYGGVLVSDLTRAQALFESFEIQRQLAFQVYKYCWPSTFLVPFIGEALFANCFTLHLARLVVKTFPHIKGYKAQQALQVFVPMDSGRYADVLINIAAAILIFFLPGGYTITLFVGLILSHVFIICFDHFRVLRCVPSFCFSSSVVDDYAQLLLILPCSLMLAAFVQKVNCSTESFCLQDSALGLTLMLSFAAHGTLHWCMLKFLVPKFGDVKEHVPTKLTYQEVASKIAPSWFNLNPAYCLRSKYFYKHEKPCTFFIQGREHVLRKSDQAMSFFEDQRPAQQQLDEEVAEVDLAAHDVERSRQEAKQKIERTQAALEAQSKKKSLRMEALETKSRHLASLEEELSRRRQEVQSASAAALKLRASAARTAMESEMKEEALLQRFVQLKSELEEHQEVSKQQDEEQKAVLEKLAEAQKKAPQKQVQARLAREKKDELEQMLLDLRSSLDAAKSTAKGEARKTRQAEEQIDRQRQELEALLADAAQQEVLAEALKSTLSEQKAEHEKFMKAHHSRASTSKDAELKVAEQVSELRVRRAELALKQEAVAAACSVEKERLAELRREFEKVRAGSLQKIEDAKKELQQDAMAKDLQALKTHEAEAASLLQKIEGMKTKQQELLRKVESDKADLPDADGGVAPSWMQGDKHTEDAESRKSQLLKELLSQRAASLQEASKESREAEMKYEALQKDQKHLQEEYRSVMEQMKSQVSQGNELYSKLQEVEQDDIRTLEDESDLLALGLHEAESQKVNLEKEIVLVQQQAMGQFSGDLQAWAKEVQSLRVTAKVQSHEDELLHWKQAASESPAIASQLQVQAAEGLLRQKESTLQDQLASKETLLQELEQQAQSEEVAGSIRSVPSALHGSLTMGPTLSVKAAAQRRALVIGCNYTGSFAPLHGCANDAWNVQCLLRQSLQYTEAQVRCLVDYAESSSTPSHRRPTRDNIIAELQWLTGNAKQGDNVLLYFSGYGAQQPDAEVDGLYQGYLVPADFADDLPEDITSEVERCCKTGSELSPEMAQRAADAGGYRLVPMSLLTSALHSLSSSCKATVIFDCCQSSVLPLLRPSDHVGQGVAPGPGPPRFKKLKPPSEQVASPISDMSRQRLLGLPALSQSSLPVTSPSSMKEESLASPAGSPAGILKVPPGSAMEATQRPVSSRGGPSCRCYCFAACQNDQACCELPIEGLVQGVATWAFVKGLAACHLNTPLAQHSKAMDGILQNLRRKYRWIQQTPVIQLSASANVQDPLILPQG